MKNLLLFVFFTLSLTLLYAQTPFTVTHNVGFQDDFNNGSFQTAWLPHPSFIGSGGVVDVVNGAGINNTPGVRIGKAFDDANFTTNTLDLYLDLSDPSLDNIEMTFWIADQRDEWQFGEGIWFSDDGGVNFKQVLDFFGNEWCDLFYGQHPPIDIDKIVAEDEDLELTSNFVIRFRQSGQFDFGGGGNAEDGFYLDNVNVYDPGLVFDTLPFTDNFDVGQYKKAWAWSFADETSTIATGSAITSPMSFVGVVNQYGWNGTPGVLIGRICDGVFTTNAFDLHLNLENESEVEMTFFIADQRDETHVDDGIYFSDDGGANFQKMLDFNPSEWCDGVWGQYPPIDVDELAAAANPPLQLTDKFVIRFQQTGQHNFDGGGNAEDGFYLDNVNVYDPDLVYKTLPISDNFDDNSLKPWWAWNFADSTTSIVGATTSPMGFVGIINQVVWMGRRCDGNTLTTNALDLHVDLLDESEVEMTFWIADQRDETHEDDGIYFSNDGGKNFKKVLDFFPSQWCDGVWGKHPPIDVDELAAAASPPLQLTDKFVIRFQQIGLSNFDGGGNAEDGFYIDDVQVYDPNLIYAPIPFDDDFETGNFKPSWAWNFADKTATIVSSDAITSPMNRVEIVNGIGNNSTFAAAIGKWCDGSFTTNALDLHLNLEGYSNIILCFDLADINEETQIDDGIYFSDNGGQSFKKVYPFSFENLNGYQTYILNVDSLCAIDTLELSDSFVIRFQQRGWSNFDGGGNAEDGYFLDNVNIKGTPTATINPKQQEKIKIFPNPTTSSVSLVLEGFQKGIRKVEINHLNGSIIKSQEFDFWGVTRNLDISELANGLYILTITLEDGGKINRKIVKE